MRGTLRIQSLRNHVNLSATTNGFILQIDELSKGAQHGGEQKSLEAQTTGATLSPSSTDDLKLVRLQRLEQPGSGNRLFNAQFLNDC